ncbi:MAG: hypothetical protein CM1200mP18_23650 [Gammaproteobacteria bacterium]|nr:MAG: hypothetical protein CM1200mP18_23650 [Gammaproteobacteria bacterium]
MLMIRSSIRWKVRRVMTGYRERSLCGLLAWAGIAGVMAEMLRRLGFSAVLNQCRQRGIAYTVDAARWFRRLSRIGELVLNPFVGPVEDRGYDPKHAPRGRSAD